jgi:RND family efflux transporter MFP subunit
VKRIPVAALLPLVALCTTLCVLLPQTGCQRTSTSETHDADESQTESQPELLLEVTTARVRRGSILQHITAPGSLLALRESHIGTQVTGRIERIFVSEGDRVQQGDPLFQIDPKPYELALSRAQASLDRTVIERHKLEADLERGRQLHTGGVVAEQTMDELESAVAMSQAIEHEARQMLAMARRDLDNTLVRAPYAASVAARLEDEGTTALVQPQTIVLVLQETSELEAQATIPEVYFAAIAVGDVALLHVEGLAQPIASEISAVSDSIDVATRTFVVKMRVPNGDHALKAGTFARVEILPLAKTDVVLVPREAVRREDGRTLVLVVRDGQVAVQPVRLGVISEDAVEVLAGVRVDDEIVVGDSTRKAAPGMRVRSVPLHRVEDTQSSAETAASAPGGS